MDECKLRPFNKKFVDSKEEVSCGLPIRHQGWLGIVYQFFTRYPCDILLIINENIKAIDWDSKSLTIARPIGNLLTIIFFTIRLLQDNVLRPNYHKIKRDADSFDFSKSKKIREFEFFNTYMLSDDHNNQSNEWYYQTLGKLDGYFKVLIGVMLVWNCFISYKFLFSYSQTYSLFFLKEKPSSINVTKKSLNDLKYKSVGDVARSSLWSMITYLFSSMYSTKEITTQNDYYYELKKWSPSKFISALFASFSPICIIFLCLTETSFVSLIAVGIHQYLFWLILIKRYELRIYDEQFIVKGTLAEIDMKSSKTRNITLQQDAIIDATYHGKQFVKFYPLVPSKSKIFTTHAITGDVIKERYNNKIGIFENISMTKTENYINDESLLLYHPLRC